MKYTPRNQKYDLRALKSKEIKDKFNAEVRNRFDALSDMEILFQDVNDQWEMLKKSVNQAAETAIPKIKIVGRKKWMTEDILELMEIRRNNKNNKEKYKEIHKKIRKLCKEAKERWLEESCKEIENQHNTGNTKLMHTRINDITNKRTHTSTGCLKTI